jgi:hypothetical protein
VTRVWEWTKMILVERSLHSFYPHRSIFLALFDEIFMFWLFLKSILWPFLVWELLCKWWVITADHSLLSVSYFYHSFFSRYVTPQIKNSSVMLLAGWFMQLFRTFYNRNSTCHMLDLTVSEQWSLGLIWGCYTSFAELSPVVTHHLQSDCQIRNRHSMLF